MRRGEHRAGRVERAGGVVHQVGRDEPEVDDVDAHLHRAASERVDELGPDGRMSRPTSTRAGAGEAREPDPERVGDLGVDLVGNGAPDVVGLDDRVEVTGPAGPSRRGVEPL